MRIIDRLKLIEGVRNPSGISKIPSSRAQTALEMRHPNPPVRFETVNQWVPHVSILRRGDFQAWTMRHLAALRSGVWPLKQPHGFSTLHCGDLLELGQDCVGHITVDMNHRDRFPRLVGILLDAATSQRKVCNVDRLLA